MEGSEVEWVTGQLCIPPLSAVKVGAKMCIEESDSVLVEETEKYIKSCRFWQTLNSFSLPLLKPRWTNISGVLFDSEKQTEEIQNA